MAVVLTRSTLRTPFLGGARFFAIFRGLAANNAVGRRRFDENTDSVLIPACLRRALTPTLPPGPRKTRSIVDSAFLPGIISTNPHFTTCAAKALVLNPTLYRPPASSAFRPPRPSQSTMGPPPPLLLSWARSPFCSRRPACRSAPPLLFSTPRRRKSSCDTLSFPRHFVTVPAPYPEGLEPVELQKSQELPLRSMDSLHLWCRLWDATATGGRPSTTKPRTETISSCAPHSKSKAQARDG
ncbi:hypothetical protein B0H12DRAFT_712874 [Mycena haematopus]|nr:hypothetical protein B0H12DRAFT_712874 [Mycena haematopus]